MEFRHDQLVWKTVGNAAMYGKVVAVVPGGYLVQWDGDKRPKPVGDASVGLTVFPFQPKSTYTRNEEIQDDRGNADDAAAMGAKTQTDSDEKNEIDGPDTASGGESEMEAGD